MLELQEINDQETAVENTTIFVRGLEL